ncbi:MAG: hypothetical protein ACNYPF_01015 [Candidatus Puniceispirillales bacterium WSBS_2018_MAG_OTU23]
MAQNFIKGIDDTPENVAKALFGGLKHKNGNHDLTAEELNLEYESAEGCRDAKRKAIDQ